MASRLIDSFEIDHLLDYGCGVNHELTDDLTPERSFQYQAYDPSVPDFADDPVSADMVVCLSLLSHLPQWQVDDALDEIERLTDHVFFCVFSTKKQPLEWWLPKLTERFNINRLQASDDEVCIVAYNLELPVH